MRSRLGKYIFRFVMFPTLIVAVAVLWVAGFEVENE